MVDGVKSGRQIKEAKTWQLLWPYSLFRLLHLQRIFNPSVFCICNEREWCTDYGTPNWVLVYFNSVIKRVKQCCCTHILLPKSTLNAIVTTTNRFLRMTIDSADDSKISNRTIDTNRISNRTYDSKSNRITKLRRSLVIAHCAVSRNLICLFQDSSPFSALCALTELIWLKDTSMLTLEISVTICRHHLQRYCYTRLAVGTLWTFIALWQCEIPCLKSSDH